MRLLVGKAVYILHIEYDPYVPKLEKIVVDYKNPAANIKRTVRTWRITRLRLHDGECKRMEANGPCVRDGLTGEARCDPRDNFSREVGRKMAFTRAIHNFSQNDRVELWKAYLRSFPPKSSKRAA